MLLKKLAVVFSLWAIVNADPAIADLANEPDGFREIKWGDSLSKHRHELKDIWDGQRGLVEESYVRINEDIHYSSIKLKEIRYTFYKGKFHSVSLTSSDSRDKDALLEYLRKQYGPGIAVDITNQYKKTKILRKWQGKQVTIQFLYTPKTGYSNVLIEYDGVIKEDAPASFRGLEWLPLGGQPAVGKTGIWYDKKTSTILNRPGKGDFPSIEVLKTIDVRTKDEYIIEYNDGPSFDPSYTVSLITRNGNKPIGSFAGMMVYVPGNGDIYVSNRANSMFEERKKFHLVDDKLETVKQPFFYVGIKTKANRQFTIYSTPDSKSPVAVLPSETEIEVLLADKESYLIKTPFGLVGWYTPDYHYHLHNRLDSPITEIFFAGD